MKNLTTLLFAILLLIGTGSALFAQGVVDERAWSRVQVNPLPSGTKYNMPNWIPADPIYRFYGVGMGATVGPNYRVHPGSNTTQSEMSIDVHPTNADIAFGSVNATNWPVTTLWGTGVYWTTSGHGESNWTGFDNPPFGTNGGDPASAIGPNGYFYEAYLTNSYSLGVATSTNFGTNWTTHIAYGVSSQDKEHLMVDKTPTSPYVNRVYLPWSDLNSSNAALVYSSDFGVTWSSYKNLSTGLGGSFYQGPNVQTAANGDVYVAYAIYDAQWTDGEDGIGFSKSTDGGDTWTNLRAFDHENFGIRGNLSSKNGIRVNSFPAMAVDRSGGPNDGNIYICWPQRNFAPAGSDPDIVLITSTDGGATWSTGTRVNDDPLNNGKDQYFPWCTVDQSTGQLIVIFYDSRDVPNNQANVYMATSNDGGYTFENIIISDQPHTPAPISGLAGGYAGDYIGVAALDNIAYPFWMDNRTGNYQGWTAEVTFGPPCPVDPATNPNPPNGTLDVPLTGNTLTWTNGAGATQIEVWFGEMGSLSQVYSGSPITSFNLGSYEPLTYNTNYGWQINSFNDTCHTNGPIWSFTTMEDPNLVEWCDDFTNLNNWTAVGPLGQANWSANNSSYAGGMPPEMYMSWSPSFVGQSTMRSDVIPGFPNNTSVDYYFRFYLDFYGSPSGEVTVGITYDGGTTVDNFYTVTDPTGNVGPLEVTGSFTTPATGSENLQIEVTYNGDSFNINWIAFDDMCLTYVVPVELTSFTAKAVSNDVELNWTTATETNNQGFDIERTLVNSQVPNWEKIGYVAGFGTTTEPKTYSFVDTKLETGSYTYRLKQIDFDGTFEYSNAVNVEVEVPIEYALEQNYPNPFNPSTTIKYSIPEDGFVKLAVYNMLGEQVATLVNAQQKSGRYEINFNASNLASGVYVYRIEAANFTASKKLMLMK
ncbi:MAG: T9SS type A sorting domain-containing protein [Ignavibacteriaceae bacterium]|nr:T9SS type A sorting domain-containing protein [Ignavibacteriaceae bacterium]MCW8817437.1 T9SS type A sorting domain-containing protein [Ignavibacteriaceae bacterium]MCW8960502.1 T9SS type A sorting domain-containing protein [Ignavibacteriaceae bacterium]